MVVTVFRAFVTRSTGPAVGSGLEVLAAAGAVWPRATSDALCGDLYPKSKILPMIYLNAEGSSAGGGVTTSSAASASESLVATCTRSPRSCP